MDRRVWRAKPQGGYVRVFEVVDGVAKSPTISVSRNKLLFGEQIARALNGAYAAGVADSQSEHFSTAKKKVADMLQEMGHDVAAEVVRKAPI